MRTKKAMYNNITSAILQIVILLFGLIIPKLMIGTYGSELNGLISSTKQIVSYLKYLEFGITSALIFTLYKPLANHDYDEINPLVNRAKKEYKKISFGYLVGIILISLIYPLIIKEKIGYMYMFSIVFLIGIYGVLDFYTLAKYSVLLEADQKVYVITLITIITTILQNVASIILLILNQSVLIVVFIPTIFLPIRSILLRFYIKKKYDYVNYDVTPSKIKLESRKDAFISGLSDSLNMTLPLVIVSLIVSLEMASVFSVYSMVFFGLIGIVSVFTLGMRAPFGNMYAKNEMDTLIKTNNYFEFILYILITILYSTAFALIIPFVNVYIGDVADINYIYPIIGVLLTTWVIFHSSRLPGQILINATGKWSLISKTNIIQILILILISIIFGYLLGINGILIGMIVAALYKTISVIYVSNKKILGIRNKRSMIRLIRIYIIVILTNAPILLNLITINVKKMSSWIIAAFLVVIWVTIITIIINLLFDWNTTKEIYSRYIKRIFTKKKKTKESEMNQL